MTNYTYALRLVDSAAQCYSTSDEDYSALRRTDGGEIPPKETLDEVWANYTPPLQWSRTELLALFTRAETRQIRSAAMVAPECASAIVLDELERRPPEHIYRSDSATLIQLLNALVAEGTLTADRPAQILAGRIPGQPEI